MTLPLEVRDLDVHARASADEKPVIEAKSDVPVQLEARWEGGSEELSPGDR
jgi:hypothetical protein